MSRTGPDMIPSPYVIGLPRETVDRAAASLGNQAFIGANEAAYTPFSLPSTQRLASVSVYSIGATGTFDIGLYDSSGARLGSLGSTSAAANTLHTWTPAVPILIEAGKRYFLAMSESSGASVWTGLSAAVINLRVGGLARQTTAHPLPSTFTAAQVTNTVWPAFSLRFVI